MPRSERTQWARLQIDGVSLLADLAGGMSLVRPVRFEGGQLHCFGAEAARSVPMRSGPFTGRVGEGKPADVGSGCNCNVLTLTPHANGTHTECAGHLTVDAQDAYRVVPQRLLPTALLTVQAQPADQTTESTDPAPRSEDRLITRHLLERAWASPALAAVWSTTSMLAHGAARALVVRTLPNSPTKFLPSDEQPAACAPYLSREAAQLLVERGIEHLVLDVPSADRAEDAGLLTAHRIFFGLPAGQVRLAQSTREECTITELAYIEAAILDGPYLLSLQTPAIAGDAVPSRPLLYPLRLA